MAFPVRHSLTFRTALALVSFTLLAGALSIGLIGLVAYERKRNDVTTRLQGLLDTVTSTASAACFVSDSLLARDIAHGLLRNSVVEGLIITANDEELANVSRSSAKIEISRLRQQGISRPIYSPFDAEAQVGEILIEPNLEELKRLNREELMFIGSVLLLQLLATTIAAIYAMFRWIVLPMKNMSDRLHKMSNGSLLPTPPGHVNTEIGRLVNDINELTTHLAFAREDAEKASQAKGDFLANISHEIRTPISAVIGMAHLALKTELTDKQRDYLQKIRDAGSHLLALVNEVLDVAKIEAGKLRLEEKTFSLAELMAHLQAMAEIKASEKGLALSVTVDRDIPPYLHGDSMRIGQILLNYLNNAIKFTEQGQISLHAQLLSAQDGRCCLRFAVSDTGIGLNAEQISRLFHSFEQADASTTRKFGGTGLSLVISKQLAALMGGQVGVASQAGQGSTFWATTNLGISSAEQLVQENQATDPPDARLTSLAGRRILLAEDNLLNQQIARELLEEQGLIVVLANNGREAVAHMASSTFDGILMDMRMPEMDGIEATRQIRSNPAHQSIPIIAMTANARMEDRQRCLQVGMNDFISKPVDPPLFFRTLRQWLTPISPATALAVVVDRPAANEMQAPTADKEVDITKIAAIVKNDPGKIVRFANSFIVSASSSLAEIEQALATNNRTQLAEIAHRLKSSARSMGAMHFGNLLDTLEHTAAAADIKELLILISDLTACWQRAEQELQDYINQQSDPR